MKRFSAIVLLLCAFTMNAGMVCRSLCIADRSIHAAGASGHVHTAKHEMPRHEMCPITHENNNGTPHHTHHSMPETSINCACSQDEEVSLDYKLTLSEVAGDLKPYLSIISKTHSQKIIVLSTEPIPLEGPPKILA